MPRPRKEEEKISERETRTEGERARVSHKMPPKNKSDLEKQDGGGGGEKEMIRHTKTAERKTPLRRMNAESCRTRVPSAAESPSEGTDCRVAAASLIA